MEMKNFVDKMKYDNQKIDTIYELVDLVISMDVKNSFVVSLNLNNMTELNLISSYLNKIFNKLHEEKQQKEQKKPPLPVIEPIY